MWQEADESITSRETAAMCVCLRVQHRHTRKTSDALTPCAITHRTVRLWDIDTCDKKQTTVIKTKNQRGQKATPHSACFSPSGNIIAGCNDGCLKLYDGKAVAKGSTQRAHAEAKGAHMVRMRILFDGVVTI